MDLELFFIIYEEEAPFETDYIYIYSEEEMNIIWALRRLGHILRNILVD